MRSRTADSRTANVDPSALDEILEWLAGAVSRGEAVDPDILVRLAAMVDDEGDADPERKVLLRDALGELSALATPPSARVDPVEPE